MFAEQQLENNIFENMSMGSSKEMIRQAVIRENVERFNI